MEKKKIINFLEFCMEVELEGCGEDKNIEAISEELEEAGISAENSEQEILKLITTANRETKLERGKKFKEEFYNLLNGSKKNMQQIEREMPELATAFRKLESASSIDNALDDEEKMKLLGYLKNKNK